MSSGRYWAEAASDPSMLKSVRRGRAEDELEGARILARLSHPGIIALHEVFFDNGATLRIVMEFCRGHDLHDALENLSATPPEEAVQSIMRQLLMAVAYLHTNTIIHRDIKPRNLMVAPSPSQAAALSVAPGV